MMNFKIEHELQVDNWVGLGWVECIILSQWKLEANAHRLNSLDVGMEMFSFQLSPIC